MLPGYNHNVKYRDCVYHVQTEDSGVDNPHIITHLFVGGNIIVSKRTAYTHLVGEESLNEALQRMMQDQHKAMLKGLIHGRFDAEISVRSAGARSLDGPAPLNVDAGGQGRASGALAGVPAPAAEPAPPAAEPAPAAAAAAASPLGQVLEATDLQAAFEAKDDRAVNAIFGNLISEKSLDEVILSYLAQDK